MTFKSRLRADAVPFFSALGFGFAAHMFMLTNKIPVDDDICFLFDKGATTVSGRYGLELLRFLMPDVSMPWIYGVMALLFLSAAVCVTVRLFEIKSRIIQVLFAGLFIAFPAETGTMSYIFTCAPYALALLLTVTAVYLFRVRNGWVRWAVCPLLLIFSCSIYQGYFAFAASFCVLLMIKDLLTDEKTTAEVFRCGLQMLALLVVSVAVYGVSVVVAGKIAAVPVLDVANKEQGLLLRIAVAYSAYLHTFLSGYFAYVNTPLSLVMHLLLAAVVAVGLIRYAVKSRDIRRIALLALCVFLLPLASYCLYLLADNGYIHSLALYPFASFYVLVAIVAENCLPERPKLCRCAAPAAMAVILLVNIYFANSFYLRCFLQYQSREAFYTAMLARVMQTEGFDENSKLAIIGDSGALDYDYDREFDFSKFQLPGNNIMKPIHAKDFINIYLGCEVAMADDEECEKLSRSGEVGSMAVYPYYGSVKNVNGYIVVKLK